MIRQETGKFFCMNITIISKDKNLADIFQYAIYTYFKSIHINEGHENSNFIFELKDTNLVVKTDNNDIASFNQPYRMGDILGIVKNTLQNNAIKEQSNPINIGSYILNPHDKILQKDKLKVRLTDKEFDIIYTLFKASPNKIPRDKLLHIIWGYGDGIETHTLETHIYRLRQKIENNPQSPEFLKTNDDGYFLNF